MRLPLEVLSLAAILLSPFTQATSSKRGPIGALTTVQNATIRTSNHRITALSKFDLTFIIDGNVHVKFNLEPNHDILNRNTLITHLAPDGTVEQQENVDRLEHKVYKGSAWIRSTRSEDDAWERVGWARTLIRRDGPSPFFEGAFSAHQDHHHIQSSTDYSQTKHRLDPDIPRLENDELEYMVLWRDSDIVLEQALAHQDLRRSVNGDASDEDVALGCGADVLGFNNDPEHPVLAGISKRSETLYGSMDYSHLLRGRQIDSQTGGNSGGVDLKSTIGNPAGCPTTRKVALVGVATDCTYTTELGSKQAVTQNVISQMNTASVIWENAFNISLGLQNLTISAAACPATPATNTEWNQACSESVSIENRLNYFSSWRGQQGGDNSHWTLLSTCNTGGTVGLAWLGQACVGASFTSNGSSTGNGQASGSETVSGANVVIRTSGGNEWPIIAHETGHTFGAVHDCDSQTCQNAAYVSSQKCCPFSSNTCSANSQYIMNPYESPGVSGFSPCTVGNICSAIGRNSVNTDCLSDNEDVHLYNGADCGNGIVEEGEDCDCGGEAGCADDPCCDATTCKYTSGSVCDDSNESCCSNCQFSSSGTVCRPGQGSCDPQEVCPGDSGNCPPDKVAPNGNNCGDGLKCASGQCTSRDEQCKTVMGSYQGGNDTHACNSQGCMISCATSGSAYGTCYGLQQNFLDGTPCDGGGHCQNVSGMTSSC